MLKLMLTNQNKHIHNYLRMCIYVYIYIYCTPPTYVFLDFSSFCTVFITFYYYFCWSYRLGTGEMP